MGVTGLAAAILESARDDLASIKQGVRSSTRSNRREAETWIWSRLVYPGSLTWCCDVLGLSPSAVRGALARVTPAPQRRRRTR